MSKLKSLFFFAFLALLGAAMTTPAQAAEVTGAGASFPYPVYSAWAMSYQKATQNRVNYQSIGSGGGIKQVKEGTVDFGATDDPLTQTDLEAANLIQFPAVVGGVVAVVNIKGVAQDQMILSGEVLADIFLGTITTWDDPAIKALNPSLNLPAAKISVIYRSDSSGTSAIFTTYLAAKSKKWKEKVGAGKSVNWPTGLGSKGNDGVSANVKRMENAISYTEYAYALQSNLATVAIINESGQPVKPNATTFTAAADQANWDQSQGYYLWLVNTPGADSWPIAAATYILVKKGDSAVLGRVTDFFKWSFANGDAEAKQLHYVPLPDSLKKDISSYWQKAGVK
ncbi:MAG: phosphate ABC transporter substrate-binding protein PstS [Deltaproteobacteria bacterium]|jgi:phosphate transport system substrate-binding protein|nr:phosphate ABC transporter substrate-binding protein PstS [Deltaproteobacteria bacterium]